MTQAQHSMERTLTKVDELAGMVGMASDEAESTELKYESVIPIGAPDTKFQTFNSNR